MREKPISFSDEDKEDERERPRDKKGRRLGFVYAAFEPEDHRPFIKVGFTFNLEDRKRTLSTGRPNSVRYFEWFRGTQADEARLHDLLKPHRYRREWYHTTAEELISDLWEVRFFVCVEQGNGRLTGDEALEALEAVPLGEILDKYEELSAGDA